MSILSKEQRGVEAFVSPSQMSQLLPVKQTQVAVLRQGEEGQEDLLRHSTDDVSQEEQQLGQPVEQNTANSPAPGSGEEQSLLEFTADDQQLQAVPGKDATTTALDVQDSDEDDDESEDDDDGHSDKEQMMSALDSEALFERGKVAFKTKDFAHAAELLSRAVEKKISETHCGELDPSLARFYLWFGDALLSKEEATDEVLCKPPQGAAAISAEAAAGPSEATEESSEATDDELAFQMLEFARRCLSIKLGYTSERVEAPTVAQIPLSCCAKGHQEQQQQTDEHQQQAAEQQTEQEAQQKEQQQQPFSAPAAAKAAAACSVAADRATVASDAADLAFVYMRLGDLQLMNSHFEEARQDYEDAVSVQATFRLAESLRLAPALSVAQATLFSGDIRQALCLFKECEALAIRIRDGELPLPKGTSLKAVQETVEDLGIQIADVEVQVKAQQRSDQRRVLGSQCDAKNLIAKTTSSFDPAVLAASNPVKRVSVPLAAAVAACEAAHPSTLKKRRIDLRTGQTHNAEDTAMAAVAPA